MTVVLVVWRKEFKSKIVSCERDLIECCFFFLLLFVFDSSNCSSAIRTATAVTTKWQKWPSAVDHLERCATAIGSASSVRLHFSLPTSMSFAPKSKVSNPIHPSFDSFNNQFVCWPFFLLDRWTSIRSCSSNCCSHRIGRFLPAQPTRWWGGTLRWFARCPFTQIFPLPAHDGSYSSRQSTRPVPFVVDIIKWIAFIATSTTTDATTTAARRSHIARDRFRWRFRWPPIGFERTVDGAFIRWPRGWRSQYFGTGRLIRGPSSGPPPQCKRCSICHRRESRQEFVCRCQWTAGPPTPLAAVPSLWQGLRPSVPPQSPHANPHRSVNFFHCQI